MPLEDQLYNTVGDATTSEVESQLQRLFKSSQFRNSPVLQALLRFIAGRATAHKEASLNEYVIAAEVFGRSSSFDSSVDTIVRTQAYRLRLKLHQYYQSEGIHDPIVIEIPKGHYVPVFHRRSVFGADAALTECVVADQMVEVAKPAGSRSSTAGLISLLALVCFGIGLLVGGKSRLPSPSFIFRNQPKESPNAVDVFWRNFLGTDRQPIVAYTNSLYLATINGDLLRFGEGPAGSRGALVGDETAQKWAANHSLLKDAGPTYFEDDLTGVGEVAAATALTEELSRVGARPLFKRSRLISVSDLSNHDAIFLGSPFVNPILNDVIKRQNFVFSMQHAGPLLWRGRIINTHPQFGEFSSYGIERDSETGVIRRDYGLISQVPGLAGHRIILLGGLTTSGTQAAAELATSVEGVKQMAAGLRGERWPGSFDYLLRVDLNQGLDIVRSECIARRSHP